MRNYLLFLVITFLAMPGFVEAQRAGPPGLQLPDTYQVNDSLGNKVGDVLTIQPANKLTIAVPVTDSFGVDRQVVINIDRKRIGHGGMLKFDTTDCTGQSYTDVEIFAGPFSDRVLFTVQSTGSIQNWDLYVANGLPQILNIRSVLVYDEFANAVTCRQTSQGSSEVVPVERIYVNFQAVFPPPYSMVIK